MTHTKILDDLIKRIERKVKHAKRRLSETNERRNRIREKGGSFTEHGGWEHGYYDARVSTLEDQLDDLKELKTALDGNGK